MLARLGFESLLAVITYHVAQNFATPFTSRFSAFPVSVFVSVNGNNTRDHYACVLFCQMAEQRRSAWRRTRWPRDDQSTSRVAWTCLWNDTTGQLRCHSSTEKCRSLGTLYYANALSIRYRTALYGIIFVGTFS